MAINFGNFGKTGTYETFAARMVENQVRYIRENDVGSLKRNNITPMDYFSSIDNSMEIIMCQEPINFVKEITKYDSSSERQEAFLRITREFKKNTVTRPKNDNWFNKSSNGVNIRLGNVEQDTGNQEPATLGDDCVHGVVVGRTGAGKSVLINNIILNLTTEYSPWELDLFLVDMKKVELSRYMANAEDGSYLTPHVSACGATSEVRYVVSMIQYLSDCMKARQTLFAALGVQKIKDFREKYSKELGADFVLPRILLLVDEFQQMFLEASGKERKILDECITEITKLGRATGVHLLFASQEMSGALGSKELANFKLRIALPCDAVISEQILGNSAASRIEEKGITLVNKKGGSKEEDNIEYRTPFINDKEGEDDSPSEFQSYLNEIHDIAVDLHFHKVQKFYQEDTQDKIEKIRKIKTSELIQRQIAEYRERNKALIDAFILGTGVLYTNKKNDFESFFLEKGKKRNIGILCAKDSDIGNTLKTLVENFGASSSKFSHTVIYESEILRSVYSTLIDELKEYGHPVKEESYNDYFFGKTQLSSIISRLNYSEGRKKIFVEFIASYFDTLSKEEKEQYIVPDCKKVYNEKTFINQIVVMLNSLPELSQDDALDEIIKSLKIKYMDVAKRIEQEKLNIETINAESAKQKPSYDSNNQIDRMIISALLKALTQFSATNKYSDVELVKSYEVFVKSIRCQKYAGPMKVVWVIGTDNIDKAEDKALSRIMENCTNYGEIFILAGANPENLEMSYRCCNYLFINTADEKLYRKYKMNFTKKSDDNKAMDFKIINYNQERSYKQLVFDCKTDSAPKLDFEGIEV